MGVGGENYGQAALPPRKTRCPLYRGLGGFQGRFGQVWKFSPPTGNQFPDLSVRSDCGKLVGKWQNINLGLKQYSVH